jgi:hypothetical protein
MAEMPAACETSRVRKQYNFWPGEVGLDAWDVQRLIELSRGLPVVDIEIDSITEVDSEYWFIDGDTERPTVRRLVEHMQLIQEVDLSFPIILAQDGRVMDGMHRIARSLLDGLRSIKAVRFDVTPTPDHRNCRPGDLPYD